MESKSKKKIDPKLLLIILVVGVFVAVLNFFVQR